MSSSPTLSTPELPSHERAAGAGGAAPWAAGATAQTTTSAAWTPEALQASAAGLTTPPARSTAPRGVRGLHACGGLVLSAAAALAVYSCSAAASAPDPASADEAGDASAAASPLPVPGPVSTVRWQAAGHAALVFVGCVAALLALARWRRPVAPSSTRSSPRAPAPPKDTPSQFICPITGEVMRDPVTTADGHAFERRAIERWLLSSGISPMTGAPLPHKQLAPAIALRQLIDMHMATSWSQPPQPAS